RYLPTAAFPRGTVTLNLAAWTDSAGNVAAATLASITVRKGPKVLYIDLQGGITLDAAGLLPEPIMSVRGHVLFQADTQSPRFQLDFDGTLLVIYLGSLASGADLMRQETRSGDALILLNRVLLQEAYGELRKLVDPDAITPAELLNDLGFPVDASSSLNGIQLPKLWGVMKIETNLEGLKNI